ncbi:MAG: hypothetical protein JO356_00830 [Acidobacteria bacterium]|nr:hypothetical protein [Acidobacteriota bacterium]
MAKKKRQKRFQAIVAVKALARERLGSPPPGRVSEDDKKKKARSEKHKLTLDRLLDPEGPD